MRTVAALLVIAPLALAAGARGQSTFVDPAPFEFAVTARETGWPFGYADRTRLRHQQVHDGMQGRPITVTAIALRRSTGDATPAPAFGADVALRLSTARTRAATIRATFADNAGSDVVQALPRRRVAFPPTSGTTEGPAPFAYVIPADRPFVFGGGNPLCTDLQVFGHTSLAALRFGLFAEGLAHDATFGVACGGLEHGTTVSTLLATHALAGAPPDAPLALLIGFDFDRAAGLPLPIDLTALGAPGCELALDPVLALRTFADAAGAASLEVPIEAAPPGAFYGAQWIAVQPGLNSLGAVTSRSSVVIPRTGRVLGRVWAEDPDATVGLAQPVFGLVVEVR